MSESLEIRNPKDEFIPARKTGACAKWFNPVYVKTKKLPKVEKPVVVNVEKYIIKIVL